MGEVFQMQGPRALSSIGGEAIRGNSDEVGIYGKKGRRLFVVGSGTRRTCGQLGGITYDFW